MDDLISVAGFPDLMYQDDERGTLVLLFDAPVPPPASAGAMPPGSTDLSFAADDTQAEIGSPDEWPAGAVSICADSNGIIETCPQAPETSTLNNNASLSVILGAALYVVLFLNG